MSQDNIRMLIKCIDAALQKFTTVQVIRSRPLEKFAARLIDHEVVVRGKAYIAWLADIADSGVFVRITMADFGGTVGRCIVRDNQLEILVALAEQGLYGLREVFLAIIDWKPDAEPGYSVH
jgi:hypothetical protein